MTKIELLKQIESEYIEELKQYTDTLYEKQQEFIELSKQRLNEIFVKFQDTELSKNVNYITISQSFISLWMDKSANFIIKSYDDSFIINQEIYCTNIYFDEIYLPYLKIYELKLYDIKKYAGKVSNFDIKKIFMENIYLLNEFLVCIMFYALRKIDVLPNINTIFLGEYYSQCSADFQQAPIYVNDIWENNITIFQKFLEKREFENLSFRTFEKFDFTKQNMDFAFFMLSTFKYCFFNMVNMKNSLIIQSDFKFCKMNHVDFSGSCLDGTIFKDCSLQNCNFTNLKILPEYEKYYIDYSGSDMKGSSFSKEMENHVLLSEEQKKSLLWI